MEVFHWDKNFETGLPSVDEQHQRLVELINRFSDLLEEDPERIQARFARAYEELAEYARFHFADERALMQSAGVDPRHLAPHLQLHAAFLADLQRFRAEAEGSREFNVRAFLRFLIHWLACHILGTDQSMARQVEAIRRGLDPASAYQESVVAPEEGRGPLLKSLSELLEVVAERNRQLTEANQSLESKVAERTQSLSEVNQTLLQTIARLHEEQERALHLSQELAKTNIQLETMAMTDLLTGLFNRRYAMERIGSELSAARRYREPLSLVLLDADGLKAINDEYGHDAGDVVIAALGSALKRLFRTSDVVCRLGGDEFLVICPRSSREEAWQIAERARAAIAATRIPAGEGEWPGSISAGIATSETAAESVEALLKAADLAVYQAKRQGRNRVVVHGAAPPRA